MKEHRYFVYMVANYSYSVLYIGVTNDLVRRIYEHKHPETVNQPDKAMSFTHKYNVNRLVLWEDTSDVHAAIAREKQLKGWKRIKKDTLVAELNPNWDDLSADWYDQN